MASGCPQVYCDQLERRNWMMAGQRVAIAYTRPLCLEASPPTDSPVVIHI